MIRIAIFDLDNTLCDYYSAFAKAQERINMVLENASIPVSSFWKLYIKENETLLTNVINGLIDGKVYRWKKFSNVCQKLSTSAGVLPDIISQIFYDETVRKIKLFADVIPFLEFLKQANVQLMAINSGDSLTQREKFRALGLYNYFTYSNFFVGEELSFLRPNHNILKRIFKDKNLLEEEILFIGNSSEDIIQRNDLGIKTIFLHRENQTLLPSHGETANSLEEVQAQLFFNTPSSISINPNTFDNTNGTGGPNLL